MRLRSRSGASFLPHPSKRTRERHLPAAYLVVCDMKRLSVQMFGDDAAALLAGFYEVDRIKSLTLGFRPRPLWRQRSRRRPPRTIVHHVAATRAGACALIVKLHWKTILKSSRNQSEQRQDHAWFGTRSRGVCLACSVCSSSVRWSSNGVLTDFVTVKANLNAVQGVSACSIQNGLMDKITFFYIRTLAIIFRPTRWLTRCVFLSTGQSEDANSEVASWNILYATLSTSVFARLQNSSVLHLVGDRFGTSHGSDLGLRVQKASTTRSPFIQKDACGCSGWVYLRHFPLAFSNS